VSAPLLRRLYYGGRDALPLGVRRALRRWIPVEALFRIRKPRVDDALPALPREAIPGRPDVVLLSRGSAAGALAATLASAGARVFTAGAGDGAEVAAPGWIVGPAGEGTAPLDRLAEAFGIRHAVTVVSDPADRRLAGELRDRRGWTILDAPADADAADFRRRARDLFPKASVVVVTLGNLELNRTCLESIATRTAWPNVELVVVDNGSTDGTREWLQSIAPGFPIPLRVIANPQNRGFAAAVNQGLAAAEGEFLCLLNNDTVVTEGWLSALVDHLRADPRLGLVGSTTNEIANEAKVPVGYRGLAQLDAWARDFTRRNRGRAVAIPMVAMFCAAMRRSVREEIGPLDERFEIGMFEDDDYSRRIRDRGLATACARDSFVHHRGRASFRALGEERYFAIFRDNERRYREKWKTAPGAGARSDPRAVPEALVFAESPIVFLPSIGWSVELVQRPHHLARAFSAAGRPVVFMCGEESHDAVDGFLEIEPKLFLYRGPRRALDAITRPILWSAAYNVPTEAAWPGGRLVYDAIDHLDVFPGSKRRLRRAQARALARAERVFAVSRGLREELAARRPDAVYLPNGVGSAAFEREILRPAPRSRPVAIYVGALARWLDFELLAAVAEANPGWDFRVHGAEIDGAWGRSRLPEVANVELRGPRPHAEVPRLLAQADVGVIPFRVSRETAFVSPLKLYEYFAAGKPPVSSPMPEAEAFAEVRIAATVAEWTAALSAALEDSRDETFTARLRALGRANDWSARGREALSLLYSDD